MCAAHGPCFLALDCPLSIIQSATKGALHTAYAHFLHRNSLSSSRTQATWLHSYPLDLAEAFTHKVGKLCNSQEHCLCLATMPGYQPQTGRKMRPTAAYLDWEGRARAPDTNKLALCVIDNHCLEVTREDGGSSRLGPVCGCLLSRQICCPSLPAHTCQQHTHT